MWMDLTYMMKILRQFFAQQVAAVFSGNFPFMVYFLIILPMARNKKKKTQACEWTLKKELKHYMM